MRDGEKRVHNRDRDRFSSPPLKRCWRQAQQQHLRQQTVELPRAQLPLLEGALQEQQQEQQPQLAVPLLEQLPLRRLLQQLPHSQVQKHPPPHPLPQTRTMRP